MRTATQSVLSVLFLIGLVLFFSPGFELRYESSGQNERRIEKHAIGSPWPWFERESETVTTASNERTTRSARVRFDSPAWLLLLATVAAGYGLHRLRSRTAEGRNERRDQAGAPQADLRDPG